MRLHGIGMQYAVRIVFEKSIPRFPEVHYFDVATTLQEDLKTLFQDGCKQLNRKLLHEVAPAPARFFLDCGANRTPKILSIPISASPFWFVSVLSLFRYVHGLFRVPVRFQPIWAIPKI